MSDKTFTRRQAFGSVSAIVAGSAVARAQGKGAAESSSARPAPPGADGAPRLAPRDELVLVAEFEEMARLKLSPAVFSTIAGGDRQALDRITLRPRMLVPTMDLDLSVELFGQKLFAPILIGPVSDQRLLHPEGELATVSGASAGKAAMVVSSHSSVPIDQIAAQAKTPLWFQAYVESDAQSQIQKAVGAGCKAVCLTVGAVPGAKGVGAVAAARIDWAAIDRLRQGVSVPVLIKGIMTPEDARSALQHGAQGLVVSNYGGLLGPSKISTIEALPGIVDAVAGKIPVLVDGSFRLGTDIIKALAFGAQAVLLGRPAMWGLAAYGAGGVQSVVELLQSELARTMSMCGKSNIKALDRTVLKVHTR